MPAGDKCREFQAALYACKRSIGLMPEQCYPRTYDGACDTHEHAFKKCLAYVANMHETPGCCMSRQMHPARSAWRLTFGCRTSSRLSTARAQLDIHCGSLRTAHAFGAHRRGRDQLTQQARAEPAAHTSRSAGLVNVSRRRRWCSSQPTVRVTLMLLGGSRSPLMSAKQRPSCSILSPRMGIRRRGTDDGPTNQAWDPKYCYYEGHYGSPPATTCYYLKFNSDGANRQMLYQGQVPLQSTFSSVAGAPPMLCEGSCIMTCDSFLMIEREACHYVRVLLEAYMCLCGHLCVVSHCRVSVDCASCVTTHWDSRERAVTVGEYILLGSWSAPARSICAHTILESPCCVQLQEAARSGACRIPGPGAGGRSLESRHVRPHRLRHARRGAPQCARSPRSFRPSLYYHISVSKAVHVRCTN